jgi:hypothetical protein
MKSKDNESEWLFLDVGSSLTAHYAVLDVFPLQTNIAAMGLIKKIHFTQIMVTTQNNRPTPQTVCLRNVIFLGVYTM